MANFSEVELNILIWIQSFATPSLDVIWQCITMLGEETWMVLAFSYLYWCYRKDMALYLSFSLFSGLAVNSVLKNVFHLARPMGEPGIRVLREETATGYSFPSGHSQLGSAAFSSLYFWWRKKRLLFLAIIASLLIAYSRLYLGVHYPKDVIVGLLLGWAVSYLCYYGYTHVRRRYLLFFLVGIVAVAAMLCFPGKTAYQSAGLFAGFFLGSWVEDRFITFQPYQGARLRRVYRWILGVCGIFAIKLTIEMFSPSPLLWVCGYGFLAFYIYALYPLIFTKLKL